MPYPIEIRLAGKADGPMWVESRRYLRIYRPALTPREEVVRLHRESEAWKRYETVRLVSTGMYGELGIEVMVPEDKLDEWWAMGGRHRLGNRVPRDAGLG